MIDTRVVGIPQEIALPVPSGVCRTNREGDVAWIVEPDDLKKINDALNAPGTIAKGAGRVTTVDGMQCAMSSGTTMGTSAFCGTATETLARIRNQAFELLVQAAFTEAISTTALRTNISIACRAVIPNGGALVVTSGNRVASGTNYCMVISCVAVDSTGKPIKLEK